MRNIFTKLRLFFVDYPIAAYLLLFTASFILFAWYQASSSFPDPDSFYHAKMALLIKEQGIIKDFPWAQFTVLKNYWIDHHFLYHLILIPFINLEKIGINPLVGIKLASLLFASFSLLVFYWVLKKYKIKGAIWYTFVLLASNPFIFRINLAKAPVLSIIFLTLGLFLIFKHRFWLLFILSFFYVWLYGGWPLILVVAGIYWIVSSISKFLKSVQTLTTNNKQPFDLAQGRQTTNNKNKSPRDFKKLPKGIFLLLKKIFKGQSFKLLLTVISGLGAGLIINPYFPQNLKFYFLQTFKIAFLNYRNIIGVGGEWYPLSFFDLIGSSVLVFIILTCALALFFLFIKKESKYSWTLFILTFVFLALTLKSRRNVEYFIPFSLTFSAFSINQVFKNINLKKYWQDAKKFVFKKKVLSFVLFLYFATFLPLITIKDIEATKNSLSHGFSFHKFEKASQWLERNSPPKSIVFHSDWDDFPILFYHNSKNYYLVGLDPTFMYEYDKEIYWLWHDITVGKKQINLYDIIKKKFGASYIFIGSEQSQMNQNIKQDSRFELKYQDDEGWIYEVR